MFLKDYFPNLKRRYQKISFSGVAFNSKQVKKNNLFFAIKGKKFDGNRYINEAIKNGARIIISSLKKEKIIDNVLFLNHKNPRQLLSLISYKIFKKKPKNLIAVTGTNGKTSVANFYHQILTLNNKRSAYIGTLGINGKSNYKKVSNTTFDSIQLSKSLDKLKKKKTDNVILEASSHGLDQHRLDGLRFDIGIFTNLSRDHLDYHKTMKKYFNAKLILFKNLMKKKSHVIFDENTKQAQIIKKICNNNNINQFTIGKNSGDLIIKNYLVSGNKQEVTFVLDKKNYSFRTNLIGKIQVKNLLMSLLAAYKSSIPINNILKAIKYIKAVPGRMEKIGSLLNNSITILDYAHTPEALKTTILSIKDQFRHRKIKLLFGCGGDRDKPKRRIMGKIANNLCENIYLTDDNPRSEDPSLIRKQIKIKISKSKLVEIPNRKKAIETAIMDLKSDEILIVAGKGHENYQEYKKRKFFSDKKCMIDAIAKRNKKLSRNLKINILNEKLDKKINKNLIINNASINSKIIKPYDIFFGINGKNFDGNKFADDALKKKASICIIDKNYTKKNPRKITVNNSLKMMTNFSSSIRNSMGIPIVAITGSAGKTSLKELLAQSLDQMMPTAFSKKSFNNKYGVPLSLLNINKKHKIGVFEIGMDKKGEINKLSKLIRPDVGVITNITYAHAKNFNTLKGIAKAKAELIDNISPGGKIILNADDYFFNFLKEKARKKHLNVITFSVSLKSNFQFIKSGKINSQNYITIESNKKRYKFRVKKDLYNYKYNLVAAVAVISNFIKIENLNKNIFYNFIQPSGRGNLKKIKLAKKIINLVDESYNSNPLSLRFSIEKFDNMKTKNKKYLLLGDMLELGKFSKKLHENLAIHVNKTKIDKIYVYGKEIINTYNKIRTQKRGKILYSEKEIMRFIKQEINNKDYLMVKGSNSTGLNKIIQKLN
tara:strand:- start:11319 stop:14138 length:2820 start_codon:yes stop_codon:yes gene_type:complete